MPEHYGEVFAGVEPGLPYVWPPGREGVKTLDPAGDRP